MKTFWIIQFEGDRYAAETLEEALDLAGLTPDTSGTKRCTYWQRLAPDAGAARMLGAGITAGVSAHWTMRVSAN